MKKNQDGKKNDIVLDDNEIPEEIDFNYNEARPNRFAKRYQESDRLVVVLEPDIAEVFTTPEAVNKALRALISTMQGLVNSETLDIHAVKEEKESYSS